MLCSIPCHTPLDRRPLQLKKETIPSRRARHSTLSAKVVRIPTAIRPDVSARTQIHAKCIRACLLGVADQDAERVWEEGGELAAGLERASDAALVRSVVTADEGVQRQTGLEQDTDLMRRVKVSHCSMAKACGKACSCVLTKLSCWH